MEDDLRRTKQLLDQRAGITPSASWMPPVNLGLMPPDVADRARALLAAQNQATTKLAEARKQAARHLAALRSVPPSSNSAQPVYLDVTG